jgi:hypothetical protein
MSDMVESGSDISVRAEARVLSQLEMWARREEVLARECLSPRTEAEQIEVCKYSSGLYRELIKAAPGVFHGRDALLAAAKDDMKEAGDAR